MALSEVAINKFSQLVYLDAVPGVGSAPTVGQLGDYYTQNPAGQLYLNRRFGNLPLEAEGWRQFLSSGLEEVADFRILNVLDDNGPKQSGFYGCSYLSPTGELVLAFRGSEMLGNRRYKNDYHTDFALTWADKTPQQKLVDRYLRLYGRDRPYILTGHSLGGNLAAYGVVAAPDKGKLLGCYAFNAPGFNLDFIRDNAAAISAVEQRLYLYQNQHDLVSSMLAGIGEPVVIASAFHPMEQEDLQMGDLFYPHSNFMFVRDGERFVREQSGSKDRLCGMVQQWTLGFLALPEVVKKAVSQLLLTVVYTSQPPEKQVAFALEGITKLYIQHGLPDSGDIGFAASSDSFLARQLWQQPQSSPALYRRLLAQQDSDAVQAAGTGILLFHLMQYALTGRCCTDK